MLYNIHNLKAMLDAGDIDRSRWQVLFANVPDTRVPTCNDCLHRRNGSCHEITTPVECFLYGPQSGSGENLLKKQNTR